MKKKTKLLLGLILILALSIVFASVAFAEGPEEEPGGGDGTGTSDIGQPPAMAKNIKDNGDGTYTIAVSVTGKSTEGSDSAAKANVVFILDASQSMYTAVSPAEYVYRQDNNGTYGLVDGEYVELTPQTFTWGPGPGDRVTVYTVPAEGDSQVAVRAQGNGGEQYVLVDGEYVLVHRVERPRPAHWEDANGNSYGNDPERYFLFTLENAVEYEGDRYARVGATRMDKTLEAMEDVAEALLAYNTTTSPNTVQIALVPFTRRSFATTGPTTSLTDFTAGFDDWRTDPDGNTVVTQYHGTNWQAALTAADDVDFGDEDPTYIIFFTDGRPTRYNDQPAPRPGEDEYGDVQGSYEHALAPARAIVDPGEKTLYSIFAFGDEGGNEESFAAASELLLRLTNYAYGKTETNGEVTEGTTDPSDYFYSASDADDLQSAFDDILSKIRKGISDVTVGDGTPSLAGTPYAVDESATSLDNNLLTVVPDSYNYYRAGGEYNPTETTMTNVKGETVNLGVVWDDAPPATEEAGTVKWDLSDLGVLENGVVYTYTFDCTLSQAALDLIADMKNDPTIYENLPEDSPLRQAFTRTKNTATGEYDYSMRTNTQVTVTYKDTREDDPQLHPSVPANLPPQDPVPADAEKINIEKIWDGWYEGETNAEEITIGIIKDGEDTASDEFTLENTGTASNPKHTNSRYISTGVMKVNTTTGAVEVIVKGHDFELTEKLPEDSEASDSELSYHWELESETMHPMLVNNQIKMLVKVDENGEEFAEAFPGGFPDGKNYAVGSDGAKYYKLEYVEPSSGEAEGAGEVEADEQGEDEDEAEPVLIGYYKESAGSAALTAKNIRRSDLNLRKIQAVEEGEDPIDATFEFDVTLTLPEDYASDEKENDIYFSLYTTKNLDQYTEDDGVFNIQNGVKKGIYLKFDNSGEQEIGKDGKWTGYYHQDISDESVITVNIPSGTDADNAPGLRFLNLPTETEYEIEEKPSDPAGFECVEDGIKVYLGQELAAEGTYEILPEAEEGQDPPTPTTVKSTISQPKTSFNVEFTNEYTLSQVTVTKDFKGIVLGEDQTMEDLFPDFVATVTFVPIKEGGEAPDPLELKLTDGDEVEEDDENEEEESTIQVSREESEDGYTWTIIGVPKDLNVEVSETGHDDVEGYVLVEAPDEIEEGDTTEYSQTEDNTYGEDGEPDTAETENPDDTPTAKGSVIKLSLINIYEPAPGTITVVKTFEGLDSAEDIPEDFKVILKGPETFNLIIADEEAQEEEEEELLTSREASSGPTIVTATPEGMTVTWTIEDAPAGDYTVSESGTTAKGYTLKKTTFDPESKKFTLQPEGDFEVDITNEYKPKSGGGAVYHWLTYDSDGGTEYPKEYWLEDTVAPITHEPIKPGYTFDGWYADAARTQPVSEVLMDRDHTVFAKWIPTETPDELNDKDHYAYINGYPDGTVRPEGNITRAEVAAIFFRLLNEDVREENLTDTNSFSDVKAGEWYNTSISTVAKMDIVAGYPDGTFRPNAYITRAEFATIAARFDKLTKGTGEHFTDIAGHWAKEYIERAAKKGWVTGYPDGTFRPDRLITRAEAATLINRVLHRDPETKEDLLPGMIEWPDNANESAWYYIDIQEASNTHDYERETKPTEKWTVLLENPDWTKYNK